MRSCVGPPLLVARGRPEAISPGGARWKPGGQLQLRRPRRRRSPVRHPRTRLSSKRFNGPRRALPRAGLTSAPTPPSSRATRAASPGLPGAALEAGHLRHAAVAHVQDALRQRPAPGPDGGPAALRGHADVAEGAVRRRPPFLPRARLHAKAQPGPLPRAQRRLQPLLQMQVELLLGQVQLEEEAGPRDGRVPLPAHRLDAQGEGERIAAWCSFPALPRELLA